MIYHMISIKILVIRVDYLIITNINSVFTNYKENFVHKSKAELMITEKKVLFVNHISGPPNTPPPKNSQLLKGKKYC